MQVSVSTKYVFTFSVPACAYWAIIKKKQFFSFYLNFITPGKKIHFVQIFQRLIIMAVAIEITGVDSR